MNRKNTIKNFGFLMFPDLEELDLAGPWEIINIWRQLAGGPQRCLLISADGRPVRCVNGMSIAADTSFADCPPLDVLLVPGGNGRRAAAADRNLLDFVRCRGARAQAVLAVCSGAFILHAAGLLENRRVATNWQVRAEFEKHSGRKTENARFVRDGRIWTAAGVSAGIDLALAFVAHCAGEETAGMVQYEAEFYPDGKIYPVPDSYSIPLYARAADD